MQQATKDAIAELLRLKAEYKEKSGGKEYKAGSPPEGAPVSVPVSSAAASETSPSSDLHADIDKQGLLVRELKAKDAKSVSDDSEYQELIVSTRPKP